MSNTQFKSIWDAFDRIVVVCCTKYQDRQEAVKKELERIGLLDRAEFFWDFPSPFTTCLQKSVRCSEYLTRRNAFNIFLNHYRVIKETFLRGFKNVLIIEDDIRFLKDGMKLAGAVKSIPPDFDLALFDRSKPYDISIDEFRTMGGCDKQPKETVGWFEFCRLTCAGCYALSRKGMQRLIGCFEKPVESNDGRMVLRHNDYYFSKRDLGDDVKLYFSFPNIAVQSILGSGSHCDMDAYWSRNVHCGIKMDDYEMSGTIPYIPGNDFIPHVDFALDRTCQKALWANGMRKGTPIINYWKDVKPLLSVIFNSHEHIGDPNCGANIKSSASAAILWGYNTGDKNRHALSDALRFDIPVLMCEPGFISSGTTWVDKNSLGKYRIEHSLVLDTRGQYFDGTRATDIEEMLNAATTLRPDEIAEAKRLIRKIVVNRISKYNHQPIFKPSIGRNGVRKVLVVDQSYGDFTISRGCASEKTFERMLQAAIAENPDADILVKTHPDTIAGKKGKKLGYYSDLKTSDYSNVYKVTMPINPYSLMDVCDRVYVCSSQFGFEALMAGKDVRVFGMPWYAGWGVTKDEIRCHRRIARHTVESLFHHFFLVYTKWVLPEEKRMATIDEVIDKMI